MPRNASFSSIVSNLHSSRRDLEFCIESARSKTTSLHAGNWFGPTLETGVPIEGSVRPVSGQGVVCFLCCVRKFAIWGRGVSNHVSDSSLIFVVWGHCLATASNVVYVVFLLRWQSFSNPYCVVLQNRSTCQPAEGHGTHLKTQLRARHEFGFFCRSLVASCLGCLARAT